MKKKKIAIIGGGCSGLFVANLLKDSEVDVYLFEKNNKLGKKILASGNGKCNFSNINELSNKYNNDFANLIIGKFGFNNTINVFENLGLIYKYDDQGRCYPVSECASSVLDCLKRGLKSTNIFLDNTVKKIVKERERYRIITSENEYLFDYVVCCSGSAASNLGSLKAYEYLSSLDIKINKLSPSLAPVKVKEDVRLLKGSRVKCLLKLINENQEIIYEELGEVMFKDDSLSGIAVFNASSYINRKKGKYKIVLDLSNGISKEFLCSYIVDKKEYYPNVFKGFLNDKLSEYIMKIFDKEYNEKNVGNIVERLCKLEFDVTSIYPLEDSQVCSGGVDLGEVNQNLELKKYPNVYAGGELLDIDGVCGGYNMQFAWSSAGVIANDLKNKIGETISE